MVRSFERQEWVKRLEVISSAKVPLIKLRGAPAECSPALRLTVDLDISPSSATHAGVRTKEYVAQQLAKWPCLRGVVLFIKQLLRESGAADAHNGGVCSFCVLLLAIRYMQHKDGQQREAEEMAAAARAAAERGWDEETKVPEGWASKGWRNGGVLYKVSDIDMKVAGLYREVSEGWRPGPGSAAGSRT